MSKRAELLAAENRLWRELCARFDRLGDQDWERPGATGDWTPKDVLAHVATWHAEITNFLEGLRVREDPTNWPTDIDAFNAEAYERCRDMTLREVRAMSGAARHRFREELAQLEEPTAETFAARIAGCGHEHYEEHLPLLDGFLAARETA